MFSLKIVKTGNTNIVVGDIPIEDTLPVAVVS